MVLYLTGNGEISIIDWTSYPGIRHLISIPAGFVKMPIRPFVFYTFLGSFVWVTILAVLGYIFGGNQDLIFKYAKGIGYGVLGLVVIVGLIIVFVRRSGHSRSAT